MDSGRCSSLKELIVLLGLGGGPLTMGKSCLSKRSPNATARTSPYAFISRGLELSPKPMRSCAESHSGVCGAHSAILAPRASKRGSHVNEFRAKAMRAVHEQRGRFRASYWQRRDQQMVQHDTLRYLRKA